MSEGTNHRPSVPLPDLARTQLCTSLKPSLHTQCRASVDALMSQFIAQSCQPLLLSKPRNRGVANVE